MRAMCVGMRVQRVCMRTYRAVYASLESLLARGGGQIPTPYSSECGRHICVSSVDNEPLLNDSEKTILKFSAWSD